jgi:hypothetical protein
MSLVADSLSKIGPCSTQELAEYLVKEHSLRPDAARKRIQRARAAKEILAAGFNFAHNQQFVYLKRHESTKKLRDNLLRTISKTNSALRAPLSGVKARGGTIPRSLFATYSGLPSSGKQPTIDRALNLLLNNGLLVEDIENDIYQLDPLFLNSPLNERRMSARLSTEQMIIAAFSDWLKLQGLISKHVDLRFGETSTQFGFHYWDLKAPCSKYPMRTGFGQNANLGYIVADVIMGRELSVADTEYFFQKCERIRRNNRMPPFLAWLIAERFAYDVIEKAQKHGIVCTTPGNLFGKQLANLLGLLSQLMEGKEFAVSKTVDIIEKLGELVEQFAHLNSAKKKLLVILFEVMVGHWLSRQYQGTLRYGRQLMGKNGIAYDSEVLIDNPGTYLKAFECKNRPTVTLADVEHWFGTVVVAIRQHYQMDEIDKYPSQEFGIWTTGVFDQEAMTTLERLKSQCTRYQISWVDGTEARNRIISLNDPRMTQTYDSFLKPKRVAFLFQ